MESTGESCWLGHPYCQAWLRAEGLLLRREAPRIPATLQGKDRFHGVLRCSGSLLFNVTNQWRDSPHFEERQGNVGRAGAQTTSPV